MIAVPFLNPGDLVGGKYAITRVIGSGGMAIVYEALHVRLDQRVALKMLLPELLERDDIVTRFDREARAAVRLRSPHVARVYDVDALPDGTPYMVMELLDGRDLAAELTLRGRLSFVDALDYVLQACDAMAEAHRQGTVHRDLKPSNLFLTREGQRDFVKVLDFGVSKIAVETELSVTSTRSALGTALYMSPEQVRSAKGVDVRTDVWSLGVVLYELLTGRAPFEGESTTAVAAAIVVDEPIPLGSLVEGLPPGLEQVVMRALAKDREKRYVDAAAFAAALAPFQALDGHTVALFALPGRAHAPTDGPTDNDAPLHHGPSRAPTEPFMENARESLRLVRAQGTDQPISQAKASATPSGVRSAETPESSAPIDVSFGGRSVSAPRAVPSYIGFQAGVPIHTPPAPRPNTRGEPPRSRRRMVIGACAAVLVALTGAIAPRVAHRLLTGDANARDGSTAAASPAVLVGILPLETPTKAAADAAAPVTAQTASAPSSPPGSPPPGAPPQSAPPSAIGEEPHPAPKATAPTSLEPAPAKRSAPPKARVAPPKRNVDLPDNPG
jgi:serine/threonine protein kinase